MPLPFALSIEHPPVEVTERRVLCPSSHRLMTNLIPMMILLQDGRLLAVWCTGPGPETNLQRFIVAAHSTDGGRTFSEPIVIVDTPGKCDINPTLMQNDAGQVIMFYHEYEGHHETRVRRSSDGGLTWSEAETNHPHCAVQGARAVRAGPGHFVLPAMFWPEAGSDRRLAGAVITTDDGKTWRRSKGTITLDHYRGLMEPSAVQLADGSLLMALRTCAGYVYFSRSTDNGETWAEPWPGREFPAPQAPPRLLKTADGRLLMAYSHGQPLEPNSHKPRNALVLVQSTDDGKTWSPPMLLDGQEDVDVQISYTTLEQVGKEVVVLYHHQPGYLTKGTTGPSAIKLVRLALGQ